MTDTKLLAEAIGNSGYKIKYLAEKMEISRQVLSNKIHGRSEFRSDEIVKLSRLLNINIEERERIFFAV